MHQFSSFTLQINVGDRSAADCAYATRIFSVQILHCFLFSKPDLPLPQADFDL